MILKARLRRQTTLAFLFFIFMAFLPLPAAAAEFNSGSIRLVLHGETGRFSLYSIQQRDSRQRPVALFFAHDPRTSFLSVKVNDRVFRMGDSPEFRTLVGEINGNPALIFESYFMQVTQEFSFVRSADSTEKNGIAVRITLENRANRQVAAGARFLLDTSLDDNSFTTNRRTINYETFLTRNDRDNFWTDRSGNISLTGSIFTGSDGDPDSVHFANWKRLSDASLRIPHQPGRNFNMLPYSVRDSAVSYYFESRPLGRGGRRSFGFYLFLNSEGGIPVNDHTVPGTEIILDMPLERLLAGDARGEQHGAEIMALMAQIDTLITSGTASEEELAAIELAMDTLRARYLSGIDSR